MGLISKKNNNFARAEDFFAHCFVFHDYSMKLPTYTFYGKKFHYVFPLAFREISPRLDVRTDDFVRTKISGCIDNQIFLPMVLRRARMQELC